MQITRLNSENDESIVFFNPLAGDINIWGNIINNLYFKKFELILIDYSGYNSKFIEYPSFDEIALQIDKEVLFNINKKVHFIGYSYGGYLIRYILKYSKLKPKSLIFIGCSLTINQRDKQVLSLLKKMINIDLLMFCKLLVLFSYENKELEKNPLLFLQTFSNLKISLDNKKVIEQQINHLVNFKSFDDEKNNINTLVIYGEKDKAFDKTVIKKYNSNFERISFKKLLDQPHMIDSTLLLKQIKTFIKK